MSSEEDRARALLHEMQARLAEGPHAALGVPTHATAADIRQAFLQLTKRFHPARFGRRAPEVQRLSNEVFLSIKGAHEALTKGQPPRRSASSTGAPPNRSSTRPFGVPIQPTTPPQGNRPSAPVIPQRPTPAVATPAARFATPATPRPQSPTTPAPIAPPPARPSVPAAKFTAPTKPTGQSQPLSTQRTGQTGQSQPIPAQRAAGSTATGEALDPALAPFLEAMARGEWDRAQQMIDTLAARNPQSKRYVAMASYCRGRRALIERRFDDARVELQTALMEDPTLELAKSAITELMMAARRR